MNENFAILELKYGNIYGGYPNYFVIAEASVLAFEVESRKIFIESCRNGLDINYVSVYPKTDELGHTIERVREVVNMKTGQTRPYLEEYKLDERALEFAFKQVRPVQNWVKRFLLTSFRKYNVRNLLIFDGRRDIFLCERAGVNFGRTRIMDLQKAINKETNYLFSLNKLAKVINLSFDNSYLRSNNLEYWIHPVAARQLRPMSAAWDAARLLMVHNEYMYHHDSFLLEAAKLVNKIEERKNQ